MTPPPTAARLLCLAAALALPSVSSAQPPASAAASPTADAGITRTASGLELRTLTEGKGPSPKATDVVRVHYRGTFPDGREFDSSHKRGQPAEFPLNRVIRCWTEGVQRMKVGGKAALVCPPAIAYGERGTPGGPIPPNATLHFEVELLGIAGR
jgi:FKBP-type peptidyl-prolyl cis-trans isomerase FkpA